MALVGLNFHGPISHPATTKLRNALCAAVNDRGEDGKRKNEKLCLFMNSLGGCLHARTPIATPYSGDDTVYLYRERN